MKLYTLESNQFINKPIEEVFQFFSKPENLSVITPAKLGFKILSPNPIKMEVGRLIDYNIYLMGIPIHWRTLITDYEPPNMFVDQQIKGPYAMWHHTHTFHKVKGGVEIKDRVVYSIPFGFLGRLLNYLWIKRDLNNIFLHRKKVIDKLFENNDYKSYT
ncbi:MAG: CDP-paratose 2-epimerase [Candidatus Marinimicrobia bacterium]|jgi:ligand-binding SRPBCC domain-containing protein|nr:CDP-paratose 2-epimerase [Candidatus Neomarinimicrobiota bacterium]MEC7935799.1 SRPBCC family protein [Candidatus Neomarinimicrobiota bacterium]MED5256643.1 SRPBCC family protein [Candidatus Neomarinimicrobiota bacterium]|tara:strand:+ start:531 stop:1007 length:477 start_codon:yes stop_codon:yes gene_type:complete